LTQSPVRIGIRGVPLGRESPLKKRVNALPRVISWSERVDRRESTRNALEIFRRGGSELEMAEELLDSGNRA
jgi:hypothetical protein